MVPSSSIAMSAPVDSVIELIILPLGPMTSPILSTGTLMVVIRGAVRVFDIALIFITHDLRVAAQICHQVIVMHRGRVVEAGPPSQIFDDPQHDYTRRLIDAIPGKTWDPTLIRVAA